MSSLAMQNRYRSQNSVYTQRLNFRLSHPQKVFFLSFYFIWEFSYYWHVQSPLSNSSAFLFFILGLSKVTVYTRTVSLRKVLIFDVTLFLIDVSIRHAIKKMKDHLIITLIPLFPWGRSTLFGQKYQTIQICACWISKSRLSPPLTL